MEQFYHYIYIYINQVRQKVDADVHLFYGSLNLYVVQVTKLHKTTLTGSEPG